MPGGPASTWEVMKPIFEAIAAKVDGEPCVIHIGPGGAGHYVKMIHNGIEYGDMQLICEAYNIFKAAGFTAAELADRLHRLERRRPRKLPHPDHRRRSSNRSDPETGKPLVDLILDTAGQKGTGKWTLINAVENAVVISTINAAVEARILSSMKDKRVAASTELARPDSRHHRRQSRSSCNKVHDALYASKIISYAQGLDLITTMGAEKGWNLDLGENRRHLARRLHHPRPLPQPHHRRLPRAIPDLDQPDARPVLQGPAQRVPAELARSRRHRHPHRHPGPRLQRLARLLRQLPQPPSSPPTCSRPSATSSAPTPTSAPTSPAARCSTPTGPRSSAE